MDSLGSGFPKSNDGTICDVHMLVDVTSLGVSTYDVLVIHYHYIAEHAKNKPVSKPNLLTTNRK